MKYIFSIIAAVFFLNTAKINAQSAFVLKPIFNQALMLNLKPDASQKQLVYKEQFSDKVVNENLSEKYQKPTISNNPSLKLFDTQVTQFSREIHLTDKIAARKDTVNVLKKFNPSKIDLFGFPLAGFSSIEPVFDTAALINNTVLVYRLRSL